MTRSLQRYRQALKLPPAPGLTRVLKTGLGLAGLGAAMSVMPEAAAPVVLGSAFGFTAGMTAHEVLCRMGRDSHS